MYRKANLATFVLLFLASAALASEPAADIRVDRLAHLGELWGTVRYLHPYLAYKEVDWDAALVAALPRVREAKNPAEYRAAVQGMLDALGDPVTRVAEKPAPPPAAAKPSGNAGEAPAISRKLDDGVLVLDPVEAFRSGNPRRILMTLPDLRTEIGQAEAVVIDLRAGKGDDPTGGFWAGYFLEQISDALVSRPCRAPAQRFLLHSGYRPQEGGTSGGYYSGFLTLFADAFEPASGQASFPKRIVFLVDEGGGAPSVAVALQAAGVARLVAEGKLGEQALVATRPVDLGEGLTAHVRVSEVIPFPGWRGMRADMELPEGSDGFETALAEARKEWPAVTAVETAVQPLPEAVFRPDKPYADMSEPDLEHRQLAVIRAWNVIHWFYPYLHLIGDWDTVLPEFLVRMEEAKTGRDYAMTVAEMMTHVPDGHTNVWGHPALDERFGAAGLPIALRWVEGAPVAVRVGDDARQAGIEAGDAILAVDGEPVEARIERITRTLTASTRPALLSRACNMLLLGPEGSTATLKVQKLDGSVREVSLARDPKKGPPPVQGDVVRILTGNLGYVDLTRLTPAEVDGLFETVKGTRGLIFDMRGYPQGTAWAIAPRINNRNAKIGAQFRRSQVSAFSPEESESGFYFSQPLPELPPGEERYTGPTVMLIDDRAISQSEHSGLFYEAANGTKFIGTATAGANGDVTRFPLPGGIWVLFTGHDVRHADGRQLQRVGLVPDVEVAPTRAGLKAGRDEVLERAMSYLEEQLE